MDCCNELPRWSLFTLVGAFLDLSIAYFLLCCSTVAFLASQFLSIFGLGLPCPYFHSLLAELPPRKIVSVQVSTWTRFPFRPCFHGSEKTRVLEARIENGGEKPEVFEAVEVEDSRGDVLQLRGSPRRSGSDANSNLDSSSSLRDKAMRRSDRRRHKGAEVEKSRCSSRNSSNSHLPQLEWPEPGRRSPSPMSSSDSTQSRDNHPLPGDVEDCRSHSSDHSDDVLNWEYGEGKSVAKFDPQGLVGSEAESIHVLEQALKKERLARSALCLELEKERSASSSAADEAMAMIERLQKEKATIEMNAKQYQRMIEEKAVYDEEEMRILKDIIVRRERELYVLGEELDVLRQMVVSSTGEMGDMVEHVPCSSLGFQGDDPLGMLLNISESNDGKETKRNEDRECLDQSSSCCKGKEMPPPVDFTTNFRSTMHSTEERAKKFQSLRPKEPNNADVENLDFQEKGIVSVDVYAPQARSSSSVMEDSSYFDESSKLGIYQTSSYFEVQVRKSQCDDVDEKNDSSQLDSELSTLDVHVVDDRTPLRRVAIEKGKTSRMGSDSAHSLDYFVPHEPRGIRNVEILSDHSSTSWAAGEQNIHRTGSDSLSMHRPFDNSLDPSRISMALVDAERTKLESEVDALRERLRIVQQGREKLNLSVEQMQKENFQMQLLQEIAFQLHKIQQLSDTTRATRRASLPPSSSKGNLKRRRCRSGSWGIHGSN